MPKFITLTPSGYNPYHTAYVNCDAIEGKEVKA